MAFVPGYEHDIFISYAHVDNQKLNIMNEGWITTLRDNLKVQLARKLGRDLATVWTDHSLPGNAALTPEIMKILRHTSVMVAILSPAYLESEWCGRERGAFLEYTKDQPGAGKRIFVVKYDDTDPIKHLDVFADLLGYKFWEKQGHGTRTLGMPFLGEEKEYWASLNDLVVDITTTLSAMKAGTARNPPPHEETTIVSASPPAPEAPNVFLAETTDDLILRRDEVRRYLTQAKVNVLPSTDYSYDPAAFRAAVEHDMADCALFVQLLSEAAGRKSPDLPHGRVGLQYEVAEASGKPIFQWRSPNLTTVGLEEVAGTDPEHHRLLTAATVRAEGIEDFKKTVKNAAFPLPLPEPPPLSCYVYLSADAEDLAEAKALAERFLKPRGISWILPLTQADPADYNDFLKTSLGFCDAALVVYQAAPANCVLNLVFQCLKHISQRREVPIPALALYDGPPPTRPQMGLSLPCLRHLNCRKDQQALETFLDTLCGGPS